VQVAVADEDRFVATGALHLRNGRRGLGVAATLPEHRHRDAQSARIGIHKWKGRVDAGRFSRHPA